MLHLKLIWESKQYYLTLMIVNGTEIMFTVNKVYDNYEYI